MEKDIGKINKNDTTDIVVRVDDFGGRKGVTIREFVTSERYTGFTKSGVRILASDFPKFKEMINSVTNEDLADVEEDSEDENKQKKLDNESSKGGDLPDY
ncbi:hypothetical protein COU59_02305 [Candidatus Pacearchaeota archaeon CG10_big_fil_rev_8_21_14_0_10_34_12]|nr:MAG: hypothetical protein COU59_02305 [Candidatus Pacearchaeota archaeon CG10_big_fil_rev_8_21_14_0_10_34_12]